MLREPTQSANRRILDFNTQAEQLLELMESRLKSGQRDAALQYLYFKLKSVYELGVAAGRRYEKDGEYPY